MPRRSRRPVHWGYFSSQHLVRLDQNWLTHDAPGFLIVVNIYLLVEGIQVILLTPDLGIFKLDVGLRRDELPSSQISA
jgi:hypothetical protein